MVRNCLHEKVIDIDKSLDALVNMKSSPSDQAFLKWIGLAIVIGAAILSNLGVNIQKISHDIVRGFYME